MMVSMSIRATSFALGPLFITGVAFAQAPGEWSQPPGEVSPQRPVESAPCGPCGSAESVMVNRWSLGAGLGSLVIAPKDSPDDKTEFTVGELALRYRATFHLELELSGASGVQRLQDGSQGNHEVRSATLAA